MLEKGISDKLELIAKDGEGFCIDFDDAWGWVGYARKDHGKRALENNFKEGLDYHLLNSGELKADKKITGNPKEVIRMTDDCFKSFCMLAQTEKGKEVRAYYITLEKQFKRRIYDVVNGKMVRRALTDVLQDFGINAIMHGHAYSTYTNLIYKAVLGMDAKHYREAHGLDEKANVREHLTAYQLKTVEKAEELVKSLINVGYDYTEIKVILLDRLTGDKPKISASAVY